MRKQAQMFDHGALVTAEQLERYSSDDRRSELVEGRIVRRSPVGGEHGHIVVRLIGLLHPYVRTRDLGFVFTEVGLKLASNPDTVRAPDVAFVRRDRIPTPLPRGFLHGQADLVIEVLSPEDRPSEVAAKTAAYLDAGVTVVVVVDPERREITSHRRLSPPVLAVSPDDVIDVGDVIPDFAFHVGDVFDMT
jgi:Uma2 family endonuclease